MMVHVHAALDSLAPLVLHQVRYDLDFPPHFTLRSQPRPIDSHVVPAATSADVAGADEANAASSVGAPPPFPGERLCQLIRAHNAGHEKKPRRQNPLQYRYHTYKL
ncbi:hypothetical protein ACHAXA_001858 [Cyclostephanos tholiformis]|uniref:Uncharacterized protein n=1 Tax=Cyclostephanos tholiformis TaxID=382380 RepID=A0ABD3RK80_9STRA